MSYKRKIIKTICTIAFIMLAGVMLLLENSATSLADEVMNTDIEANLEPSDDINEESKDELDYDFDMELELHSISPGKVKLIWEENDDINIIKIYRKRNNSHYLNIATVDNHKNYYRDTGIKYNQKYRYKIVPYYVDGTKGKSDYAYFYNKKIVQINHKKYSYAEMYKDIKELSLKYSDVCDYEIVGTTSQGRKIIDLIIGDREADKSIMVVCTVHAREYVCSAVQMMIAEYYLKNYNKSICKTKVCEIFDNVQVHVIVMANPDGVTIAQKKNSNWKSNGRGVDLNRNFPYRFHRKGSRGASEYSGQSAASERETKAIIKLAKQLKKKNHLCAVINYHAMGQIIFGDYAGSNKRVRKYTSKLYKLARGKTGYGDASWYPGTSYGNFREYIMYNIKIPSITIEVGSTPCPVDYREYNSIFKKCKDIIIETGKMFTNS